MVHPLVLELKRELSLLSLEQLLERVNLRVGEEDARCSEAESPPPENPVADMLLHADAVQMDSAGRQQMYIGLLIKLHLGRALAVSTAAAVSTASSVAPPTVLAPPVPHVVSACSASTERSILAGGCAA